MRELDASGFPLIGNHLIEASAGTGKTWTIAALYTRLVLGHGEVEGVPAPALMPPNILVVTFTEAATEELRERIRARLVEAAEAFLAPDVPDEPFLSALRASYPAERHP
ncbi:MAG: UvrD-helicase domain-containing protein, partial [Halothiobacillaceae bacterium]|nr:UvrD-helicase domain-containing protein [Halothiobacillaceae bacterium]